MPGPARRRARRRRERLEAWALLTAVFVASVSGITYELLLGTTASFLLGNTVTEWSLTIGVFLAAMGIGSWLSRFVAAPATEDEHPSAMGLLRPLIRLEIGMALIGGFSGLGLFATFAWAESAFRPVLYLVVGLLGAGVGMEVPLLARALARYGDLRETLSSVFGVDYGGALLASVAFPLLLYPTLGVARTAMVASCFNLLGALLILWAIRPPAPTTDPDPEPDPDPDRGPDEAPDPDARNEETPSRPRRPVHRPGLVFVLLTLALVVAGLFFAGSLTRRVDEALFWPEQIVYADVSEYQQLTLTRHPDGDAVQLYLNGHLQFSSRDERRYHEALVHVPAGLTEGRRRALILGGGDGLVARELFALGFDAVTMVDLDPMVTGLAAAHPLLREVNDESMRDPRLTVVHADALRWLRDQGSDFDLIVADLPDPSTPGLARLYTVQMYRLLGARLAPRGVGVVQAGSPYYAREAFWCVEASIREAGLHTLPYRTNVPSFGEWGFVAVAHRELRAPRTLPEVSRTYLTPDVLPSLFVFPPDMSDTEETPHTLLQPRLPALFTEGWRRRGS